jgi:hypothetical protein
VQQSFNVAKSAQTVSFSSPLPTNPTVQGPVATVSGSATSMLSPVFSSTTTAVCTVSGFTVTFVAVGTCTVAINQAGNQNFEVKNGEMFTS